jgi:hypothetical protein
VELANSRIASFEAEANDREVAKTNAAAEERARNTHMFDVIDASRTAGSLTVAPGSLAFETKKPDKANRHNMTIQCSEIRRIEQGQSAFVPPHVNLFLTAVNGKERQLMFFTSSGGTGFLVKTPIVDVTSSVIAAIIDACKMTRLNK